MDILEQVLKIFMNSLIDDRMRADTDFKHYFKT